MSRNLQINIKEVDKIRAVLQENGCEIGDTVTVTTLVEAMRILAKNNMIYRLKTIYDNDWKQIGSELVIPEKPAPDVRSGSSYYEYSFWESAINDIKTGNLRLLKSNNGQYSFVCSQIASALGVKVIDFTGIAKFEYSTGWTTVTLGNLDFEAWTECKYNNPVTFIGGDFEIPRTLCAASRGACSKVTLNGNLWLMGNHAKARPTTIPEKLTLNGSIIVNSTKLTYKTIKEYNERDERISAIEQKLEVTKKIEDARKKRLITFKDNYGNQLEIGSVVAYAGSGTNASIHLGVVTGQTEKMVRIKEAYTNNNVTKMGHQIVRLS